MADEHSNLDEAPGAGQRAGEPPDAAGGAEGSGTSSRPRRRRDRNRRRGHGRSQPEADTAVRRDPANTTPKVAAPRPAEERRQRRRRREGVHSPAAVVDANDAATAVSPSRTGARRRKREFDAPHPETRPAPEKTRPVAQRSSRAAPALGRGFWIAVGVLTVAALVVRLVGLGHGLWADEIYATIESFRTPFPQTLAIFPGDNKHPLYSLLAHGTLTAFGESAWSVRLPAVAFGVATVPMLYALGTRVTSRVEALAAAALLTFSYHHVWFSQNARGYTALAFFAVLSTVLLLQAMRSTAWRWWVWYGIVAGLAAYTHLTFVFTAIAQAVVMALAVLGWPGRDRQLNWRGPALGFALAAGLTILLYLPMFTQVAAFFLHKQSNLRGISSPSWALGEAIRNLRLGFGGLFGMGLAILVGGAAVGLAGAVSYARQNARTFLLLTLPAVVTVMGAFAARGTMYPRFFFLLAGFALLIGMRGCFVTAEWVARRLCWSETAGHRLGAAVAGAVIVLSAATVPLNWRYPKQDFEGAMAYVEREAGSSDRIVVADVTASVYGPYYDRPWHVVRSGEEMDGWRRKVEAGGRPLWFVYTFPRYLEKFSHSLATYAQRECTGDRVRRFRGTVGDGDILVCRLDPS